MATRDAGATMPPAAEIAKVPVPPAAPPTAPSPAAARPSIRWWLVGPLGTLMLTVLVRWLSSGLRQLGSDRHRDRDPHAALASLKQVLPLTVGDVVPSSRSSCWPPSSLLSDRTWWWVR